MRRSGVSKILYASGSGIYGDLGETEADEDYGPLLPVSTYGASKLAGEALITAYSHMFDFTGRVFRFGNVVGPRQTHGVGFDFLRQLLNNPTCLRILGDGKQSKSYIHVSDVVNAVLLASSASTDRFAAYNVATGDYITVTEIARLAVECLDLDLRQVRFEYTGGSRGWERRRSGCAFRPGSNPPTRLEMPEFTRGFGAVSAGHDSRSERRPDMSASERGVSDLARDDWNKHWDEYADSVERNPAQVYRRKLIFSLLNLSGTGDGTKLLDIGSGQGDFAAELRRRFPSTEILGLEMSESGVAISQAKVKNARFVQRNLLEAGEPAEDQRRWATHAVCSEVIEHVDDPCELLRRSKAYMAPGCTLVVTAPGGPISAFDKHIGHRKHFSQSDIATLLTKAGYETQYVSSAGFPFFNVYRLLVVFRGRKLIDDVRSANRKAKSRIAKAAMWMLERHHSG